MRPENGSTQPAPADWSRVPARVRALFDLLAARGVDAWLVGGTARDLLLGRPLDDVDIGVAASPAALRDALPGDYLAAEQPGADFGSMRVAIEGELFEVTSLRRESGYADGRRPDRVDFVDEVEVDAARRDFTINAIYVARGGHVLDPEGGLPDLEALRLRVVGDAERRLREDPLRVWRGLRFCATHACVPDAETWGALCAAAAQVARVPRTRARVEFEKLLCARGRARGLMLVCRTGVAAHVLPGLAELAEVPQPPEYHPEGDVLRHTALVLASLEDPVPPVLAWAALFHDIAKRETFERAADRIRFHGHDSKSAERAAAWLRAYGGTRQLADEVAEIVAEHIRIASVPGFRAAKRERFLRGPLFAEHLAFHRADCLASHAKLDIYEELRAAKAALPPEPPAPLLRGQDLLELGLRPGPVIGRCLAELENERAEGRVRTRDEAVEFVHSFVTRGSMSGPSTPKRTP